MTALRALALPLLALMLSGCGMLFGEDGVFRDRGNDYRLARVEPPLSMPEGIDSEAIDDRYAIPPIEDNSALNKDYEVPRPAALELAAERDAVRVNTLADQQWILVNGAPGSVWPRLRGFLALHSLPVTRADATAGIIETAWLQPLAEGAPKERYRIRIDQGVQRETTEVHVLHADQRAGDDWAAQSSSRDREKAMIDELAQYLADSVGIGGVSMLAQKAIDSEGKVRLNAAEGETPSIQLSLPFFRAWASLGRALDKAGFTTDDLNSSERRYFVSYVEAPEEEDEGFWSWLFDWGDDELPPAEEYFVRVQEQPADEVRITIERQDGEVLSEGETVQLLKLIMKHLA